MLAQPGSAPRAGDGLRVLAITNMYPTHDRPAYGGFVAAQVESLRAEGVHVDVHFIDGRSSRWAYAGAARAIRSRLLSGRYDLVHAHYGYTAIYPLLLGSTPVVVTFHGSDALIEDRGARIDLRWLKTRIRDFVAGRSCAVVVQSAEMKRVLALPSAHIIPMGIDLQRFRPLDRAACRTQLGYDPAERAVLFPYDPRIPVKNYPLADEAMSLVRRALPGATLRVVSSARPADMPLHYNAADCLVLTSFREGGPLVVKEALACDLPVVATNCGDVSSMLDGVSHCALAERSAASVATHLLEVLSSPDPRSNGRARMQTYDLRATARRIIDLYMDVRS